jgi:hypothetical protein
MAIAWLLRILNVLMVLAAGVFFHWPLLLGLVLACVMFVTSAGSTGHR